MATKLTPTQEAALQVIRERFAAYKHPVEAPMGVRVATIKALQDAGCITVEEELNRSVRRLYRNFGKSYVGNQVIESVIYRITPINQ